MGHGYTCLAMSRRRSVTITGVAQESLLGGRFRLDERIGTGGTSSEFSLWKGTDRLLSRPVTIHLLPSGIPVPPGVTEAVRAAAKVSDPRLATIYDTDFSTECPYIVSEWTRGTHLEDLVLSGLPTPALAAAMIADAADALAVAHQAGRPHLRLTPHSLRWDRRSGLKITGLGLDAALYGPGSYGPGSYGRESYGRDSYGLDSFGPGSYGRESYGLDSFGPGSLDDTRALACMLYALLTGYWPGQGVTALPAAPLYKGRICTPRQVRAGVPALLDAITYRALRGEAPDAPARPLTLSGFALALHGVQRPSYLQADPPEWVSEVSQGSRGSRPRARHARARTGLLHGTTLLRTAD
jgi:serine/threonine protein kinase